MEKLTKSVQDKAFWCRLIADDVALVDENTNVLKTSLNVEERY